MSKTNTLIKFLIKEMHEFMDRMEARMDQKLSDSKESVNSEAKTDQQPSGANGQTPDAEAEQPYSKTTVPVDESNSSPVDIGILDKDPDADQPDAKEAGVQPSSISPVSPLTVDGEHVSTDPKDSQKENHNEENDMIIKSTDNVGPDIELSDAVNSINSARDNGKGPDEAPEVDTSKINKPTPIGAFAEQSVNGPISEEEPEGDASAVELPKEEERPVQEDLTDPAPKAEPMPVDENQQPLANTKVESTFQPKTFNDDQPVLSAQQPDAEKPADLGLDTPVVGEDPTEANEAQEAAFPTLSADDSDKEIAPAPLGDDASPSNAAAPSEIVKDGGSENINGSSAAADETAVIDKSEAPSTTETGDLKSSDDKESDEIKTDKE